MEEKEQGSKMGCSADIYRPFLGSLEGIFVREIETWMQPALTRHLHPGTEVQGGSVHCQTQSQRHTRRTKDSLVCSHSGLGQTFKLL